MFARRFALGLLAALLLFPLASSTYAQGGLTPEEWRFCAREPRLTRA